MQQVQLELDRLRREDLFRSPETQSQGLEVWCSNDYLGFAREHCNGASRHWGGSGASPLVSGFHVEHMAACRDLEDWLRTPTCTLFSSGYAANVGVLQALAGPGDLIVSDALNHASIVDGCRLSRARVEIFPHLDLAAAERELVRPARRKWLVTEAYFSMDADSPDLPRLRDICNRAGAGLIVDEAHSLGTVGPEGRGQCAACATVPDVLVGTFGKAFGLQGAFAAGSAIVRDALWNSARSMVFSTAPSPSLAATISYRVAQVRNADDRRTAMYRQAAALRSTVAAGGWGPIVPWVLGEARTALRASADLRAQGYHVPAIRPPSVPRETSRLRITASARPPGNLDAFLSALRNTMSATVR